MTKVFFLTLILNQVIKVRYPIESKQMLPKSKVFSSMPLDSERAVVVVDQDPDLFRLLCAHLKGNVIHSGVNAPHVLLVRYDLIRALKETVDSLLPGVPEPEETLDILNSPELLDDNYFVRGSLLYISLSLIEFVKKFHSESPLPIVCNEVLNAEWGKASGNIPGWVYKEYIHLEANLRILEDYANQFEVEKMG